MKSWYFQPIATGCVLLGCLFIFAACYTMEYALKGPHSSRYLKKYSYIEKGVLRVFDVIVAFSILKVKAEAEQGSLSALARAG